MQNSPTQSCRPRPRIQRARRRRRDARRPAAGGLRGGARGRQARAGHAPLRRAADRRHGAAPRQDRRDAHRRRQDAGRDAARLPQCARRQGRARGHRQRLPGQARRRVDGRVYRFLGLSVGVDPAADAHEDKQAAYAADITYGTNNEFGFDYLRDNMVYAGRRAGAARPELRHRRRGRLDPDRRGAHAADHLRPGRGPHRALPRINESCRRCSSRWQRGKARASRPATTGSTKGAPGACSPRPGTRTPSSC